MKKILFLIHDLAHGGAEKVLVNLVNNMDPEKYDISVTVLFGGGINEQFLKPHIHFHAVFPKSIPGNSHIMKLLSPKQLHKLCVKETYDVEVAYLEGPSARVISGCQNENTKLVCWIHVEQHTQEIASKAFRTYREAQTCYQKFHKIVCVSQDVKLDFEKIFPMRKDACVLYNTNETDAILEQKDDAVEPDVFHENEIRLCGVGKLMPIKGFDKLARIHKRFRDEGYHIHTYVLGIGPEKEKIEKYIEENGIQDSFSLLGYQKNPYKYVAKCDLFVCASTAEGFSTAATEALIVGVPVCTVEVSGMKELLGENNEYGVVTENNETALYEGIKRFLDNPEYLQYYKKKASLRGTTFDKQHTVEAVQDMFEQLCCETRGKDGKRSFWE